MMVIGYDTIDRLKSNRLALSRVGCLKRGRNSRLSNFITPIIMFLSISAAVKSDTLEFGRLYLHLSFH